MKKEILYDVVIYSLATGEIESIPGKAMQMDIGHFNAVRCLGTVLGRLNEHYSAVIVDAGQYKKGDLIEGYKKGYGGN